MASGCKKLFIVGCPRSGTTWVQLLLAQHPQVATAPETQIFAYYLDHFRRQWRHEHEGPGRKHQGQAGLSRLLSEGEFLELCRRAASYVLEKIAEQKPGASVVAEKSPKHALEAAFIRRVFPDAYFLHVVRDPRDTAVSLMAAGRSWADWAPRSAIAAGRMWRSCVQSAREVAGGERYREIRYESLQANGSRELRDLGEWLGIGWDAAAAEEAIRACELSQLRKSADGKLPVPGEKSPEGFFRNGTVGNWQTDLTSSDVRVIEQICGDLMNIFGYETVAGGRKSLRIPLHNGVQRVRESIDWQLEKLVRSI